MNLKWEVNKAEYSNAKILYLGNFAVGTVFWDSINPPKDLHYGIKCSLPGVKSRFENKATEEEAKERLEFVVKYWIRNAGLQIKGDE